MNDEVFGLWYRQQPAGRWVMLAAGNRSICEAEQTHRHNAQRFDGQFVILPAGMLPHGACFAPSATAAVRAAG
jgi:hypothetical protein